VAKQKKSTTFESVNCQNISRSLGLGLTETLCDVCKRLA